MNGFEKRAEAIKSRIKLTALAMLKGTTPRKLRIADLAKEAGVSQVTIYNYFGGKDALLREVLVESIGQATAEFERIVREQLPLKEIMRYSILLDREVYSAFPPDYLKRQLEEDPTFAAYIETVYRERALPAVIRFIEDGKRRGVITDKVSTETMIAYIGIFKEHAASTLDFAQRTGDLDRFLEEAVHLFFYGFSGQEPQE